MSFFSVPASAQAPKMPPAPRFSNWKAADAVESFSSRSTEVLSGSPGSTFFQTSSSDEETLELQDFSSHRSPPGLSAAQQLLSVDMPSKTASQSEAWTTTDVPSQILRRIQELEDMKAQLSQLEMAHYAALAQTQSPISAPAAMQISSQGSHPMPAFQQFQGSTFLTTSGVGSTLPMESAVHLRSQLVPAQPGFEHSVVALGSQNAGSGWTVPQPHERGVNIRKKQVTSLSDWRGPHAMTSRPSYSAAVQKEAFETPAEFAIQKSINQELLAASAAEGENCAFQVLAVAADHLEQMNGVNLSTAIHRIARACQQFKHTAEEVKKAPAFVSVLVVAERMVLQELESMEGRMPVKCCTIIAWSCASLRVFRNSLFQVLARLATAKLKQCQSYEMTNMMWAFAELSKSRRKLGTDLKEDVERLLEATSQVFDSRPIGGWKLQVLMSALVSLSVLPWQKSSQHLFTDIAVELALRQDELADQKTKPLSMAFSELRKKPQAFRDVLHALLERFPDFTSRYVLREK